MAVTEQNLESIENLILGVRDYFDVDLLSDMQRKALTTIIEAVRDRAVGLGKDLNHQIVDQRRRAQRQVILIDGARGAGKTHLLRVAGKVLPYLGTSPRRSGDKDDGLRAIELLLKLVPKGDRPATLDLHDSLSDAFELAAVRGGSRERHRFTGAVHVLPPIFPADMEGEESPITHILMHLISWLDPKEKESDDSAAKALIRECQGLASLWMFARKFGVESILYNTPNIERFQAQYGEHAAEAAKRLIKWRDLVSKILDFKGRSVLVVLFDEVDTDRAINSGILQMLRSYLDHDRIVTIAAGNLRSLRHSLVVKTNEAIGHAAEAQASGTTLRELRDAARLETEERLQKIFPTWQHFFLKPNRSGGGETSSTPGPGDNCRVEIDEAIAHYGIKHFDQIARDILSILRKDFVQAKVTAYHEFRGSNDEVSPRDRRNLEDFIAWWLFRRHYLNELRPFPPRHIIAFLAHVLPYLRDRAESHSPHRKRLSVIFFERAENALLTHQFSDWDSSVLAWLKRQELGSVWKGKRCFLINKRAYFEGQYPFDLISFRIDVGVSMPLKANEQEAVPPELLPSFVGFERWGAICEEAKEMDHQLFGIAKSITHCIIPANCVLMKDLLSLPEAAFEADNRSALQADATSGDLSNGAASDGRLWEARLAEDWPQFFGHNRRQPVMRWLVRNVFSSLGSLDRGRAAALADRMNPPGIAEVYEILQADREFDDDARVRACASLVADLRRAWLAMVAYYHSLQRTVSPERFSDRNEIQPETNEDLLDIQDAEPDGRPQLFGLPLLDTLYKIFSVHPALHCWFGCHNGAAPACREDSAEALIEQLKDRDLESVDRERERFRKFLGDFASPMEFAPAERTPGQEAEATGGRGFDERRLFRPTLLFIHAIIPCVPSLALLAALTAPRDDERPSAVEEWKEFLRRATMFLAFARRELIVGRDLMETHADQGAGPPPREIDSMYLPDFSWFSLFGDKPHFRGKFRLGWRRGLLLSAADNSYHAHRALEALGRKVGDDASGRL